MNSEAKKTEAFLKAYDDYAEAIFRHCYFRVFDRDHAKDLVQETFARTWEYLADGHEVQSLKSFLYKIANNLIIDASRKKKFQSLDALQEEGFDPPAREDEKILEKVEIREAIKVIRKLDDKYRDVMIMRFIDDLTPSEIAAITGDTENAVSVRIHRGVKKIRQILDSDIDK